MISKCLNISDPIIKELVNIYGETRTALIIDKYFSNSEFTVESFTKVANREIANGNISMLEANRTKPKPIKTKKPISELDLVKLKDIIPSDIRVELFSSYLEILNNGDVAVGAFRNSVIELSNLATVNDMYHEAFHSVFRTMLSKDEQFIVLNEARKKYLKPSGSDISTISENSNVSREEAIDIYYEEMMSNDFSAFMSNESVELEKGTYSFFDVLKKWINRIFTSKDKIDNLFTNIKRGNYTGNTINKSINPTVYTSLRHPFLTPDQVREITKQLAYVALEDNNEIFHKGNISSDMVNQNISIYALDFMDSAQDMESPDITQAFIDELLDFENLTSNGLPSLNPAWEKRMLEYLDKELGLKVKKGKFNEAIKKDRAQIQDNTDEDQENQVNVGFLKSSYEISARHSSTDKIKFLVSTIPGLEITKNGVVPKLSKITGFPTFNDFSYTWAIIQRSLSGIVPVTSVTDPNSDVSETTDVIDTIIETLQRDASYVPELGKVAERLLASDEQTQSQFAAVFTMQRGNYQTLMIDPGNKSVTIIDEDLSTKERSLVNEWAYKFRELVGDKVEVADPVNQSFYYRYEYNEAKINELRGAFDELRQLTIRDLKAEKLTPQTFAKLKDVLSNLGIDNLDSRTYKRIINEYKEPVEQFNGNVDFRDMSAFDDFISDFAKIRHGLQNLKGTISNQTNFILNEGRVIKDIIARNETFFNVSKGEAMTRLAGGPTWIYQDHNSTSLLLNQVKSGDMTQIDNILGSKFSQYSLIANNFKNNPEAVKDAQLILYGGNKLKGKNDSNSKAQDLEYSDQLLDVLHRAANGTMIGLAEADKGQQTYYKGFFTPLTSDLMYNEDVITVVDPNSPSGYSDKRRIKGIKFQHKNPEVIGVFRNYLKAEIERIREAQVAMYGDERNGIAPTPHEELIPNYHYYIVDNKIVEGNAFNSYIFPNIMDKLRELGLQDENGEFMPTQDLNAYENNQKLTNYIGKQLISTIKKDIDVFTKAGIIKNDNTNGVVSERIDPKLLTKRNALSIIADYSINSLVMNIESTMMFNGDPAFYKMKLKTTKGKDGSVTVNPWHTQNHFTDFMKRIPGAIATGKLSRVIKGVTKVKYKSIVVKDIMIDSSYFTKEKIDELAENITSTNKSYSKDEVVDLLSGYLKINQTDAQAWITMDAFRERSRSYGKWDMQGPQETAYQKIKNDPDAVLSNIELEVLMQPLKTVHFELVKKNGMMVPHFNKQSEAPLIPFLLKGTELEKLMKFMERESIDHAIVGDGKKSGQYNVLDVKGDGYTIADLSETKVTPTELSYTNLFLQQDLTPHGTGDTTVGSQSTKNIMGTVDRNSTYNDGYDTYTGNEAAFALGDMVAQQSDYHTEKVNKEFGFTEDGGLLYNVETKNTLFNEKLITLLEGDISENQMEQLRNNVPLDSLNLPQKVQNKVNNTITKAAVKIKQNGGAFIQMSNFGMISAGTSKVEDSIKNGIVWFKDPLEPLKPMEMNEDGVSNSRPAQVLLPWDRLMEMLESQLDKQNIDVSTLTPADVQKLIGKGVLEGLSYRIPNQAAGSNDAFEIVGLLPPHAGDTIIMYSEVTAKMGSDFDIDKAYIILPEIYWDQKANKLKAHKYSPQMKGINDERYIKGLNNKRLGLMRDILLNANSYMAVMSPLDNPWLENYAKELFPEVKDDSDFSFFRGPVQLENKNTFDTAKNLVGSIANHVAHYNLSKPFELGFDSYYLGRGNKDESGDTKFDTNVNGESVDEAGNSIAITLSAFMNAIVDAVKNPFISRSNINTKTANTAFMLARAGVDRKWIVAFIGQPILRDYVDMMSNLESRGVEFQKDSLRYFLDSRGYEDISIPELLGSDTFTEGGGNSLNISNLERDIKSGKTSNELLVLATFLRYRNKSKDLNDLLKVSKVDVDGAGRSITQTKLIKNSFVNMLKNKAIKNADKLLGVEYSNEYGPLFLSMDETIKNKSMIGTMLENAVVNYIDNTRGLFLNNTLSFDHVVYTIANNSGYLNLSNTEGDLDLVNTIGNSLLTAIKQNSPTFNNNPDYIRELLYGSSDKPKLVDRLLVAKNNPALKNNGVIKLLNVNTINEEGSIPRIVVNDNIEDGLYIEAEKLLELDKELAEDLFNYAFLTSGFNVTANSFAAHIPENWKKENGFMEYVSDELSKSVNSYHRYYKYIDDIYKNNVNNNKLVKSINEKDVQNVRLENRDKDVHASLIFKVIQTESNQKYIAGLDHNNNPVYHRFIKRNIEGYTMLYELVGHLPSPDSHISPYAVYLRTEAKGYDASGIAIEEYSEDRSAFSENWLSLKMNENIDILKTRILTTLENPISLATKELPVDYFEREYSEKEDIDENEYQQLLEEVKYCKGIK